MVLSSQKVCETQTTGLTYDPALSRFVQTSSLIPGVCNPLAWDRYAYTLNAPTRYTDPSGHEICSIDGWCGEYNPYTDIQTLSEHYGITFLGNWSTNDKLAALIGAIAVAGALAQPTGMASIVSFKAVFGELAFIRSNDNPGYWGQYSNSTITFFAGAKQWTTLVAHELGHAFNARIANNGGSTPYATLAKLGIWTSNGEQIAGYKVGYTVLGTGTTCGNGSQQCFDPEGNPIPENHYYRRNLGLGFIHSNDQSSNEDFADTFANWATRSLSNDGYGKARFNFMTTNMVEWVNSARGGR